MPPLGGSATPDWSREWLTLAKMRVAGHLFFFFFFILKYLSTLRVDP
jgi:hypothetical protein